MTQGRSGRPGVTCVNGHVSPDGQYFCGQCGDLLEPDAVLCLAGHANPNDRRFCGECGAPLVAPPGVEPGSPTARWSVDPTGRHQCRYWNGDAWTEHVADSGTLGHDRMPAASGSRTETWVALVIGLVTLALLVGAGADIWVQLSRNAAAPSTAVTSTTTPTSPTTPTAPVSTTTTTSTAPSPAVVAAPCQPGGGNGVAADGSVTYCERLADTDRYLWSLNPGDIPAPEVGQGGDPAIGVCMVQTARSEAECVEYLQPAQ
ncbi:hypothetical protein FHT44_002719 [Mycolicibacterium sp. BK634]|uniref:DUF2510 domain-containing protein n=1 Tax=Mycolicibacterium sp. BK634 TaxID=2587099 RepID=UPI00161AA04F|nr:DUF2510 domain-containing protein [Mycolicibacterium sp. BK634]MBB3750258.1 hypothetical protein [Mycolicibacterium sp. BK634]